MPPREGAVYKQHSSHHSTGRSALEIWGNCLLSQAAPANPGADQGWPCPKPCVCQCPCKHHPAATAWLLPLYLTSWAARGRACLCAVEGRGCAGCVCCRGCMCTVGVCVRGTDAIWGWHTCQHALQGGCAPCGTWCRHQGLHELTGPGPQAPASQTARSPGSCEHQHPPCTCLFHPTEAS